MIRVYHSFCPFNIHSRPEILYRIGMTMATGVEGKRWHGDQHFHKIVLTKWKKSKYCSSNFPEIFPIQSKFYETKLIWNTDNEISTIWYVSGLENQAGQRAVSLWPNNAFASVCRNRWFNSIRQGSRFGSPFASQLGQIANANQFVVHICMSSQN